MFVLIKEITSKKGSKFTRSHDLLSSMSLKRDLQDRWSWKHDSSGSNSTYSLIQRDSTFMDGVFFQKLWSELVPLKVGIQPA